MAASNRRLSSLPRPSDKTRFGRTFLTRVVGQTARVLCALAIAGVLNEISRRVAPWISQLSPFCVLIVRIAQLALGWLVLGTILFGWPPFPGGGNGDDGEWTEGEEKGNN